MCFGLVVKNQSNIFIRSIVSFLFLSITFSYLSIKDKKIYDNNSNYYYTHDEFIDFLSYDSIFIKDQNFKKYQKSNNRLKFNKSWFVYLVSISSIGIGIEGIQSPEKWEEGGEEYDPKNPDDEPPGINNILFGSLLYISYFEYHKVRKSRSLVRLLNKYNLTYSYWEEDVPILEISQKFRYSTQILLNERIPYTLAAYSFIYDINKNSEIHITLGSAIVSFAYSLGFKYYLNDKYSNSFFLSASSYNASTVNGVDFPKQSRGPILSTGFSIPFQLGLHKIEKSAINFGVSHIWDFDYYIKQYFVNLELTN